MFIELIYLSVLFPLLGFIINGLFGRKIKSENTIGLIGSASVGVSFLIILLAFIDNLLLPPDARKSIVTLFSWIKVANIDISFSYQVDQLSLIMGLIVSGVGFLIHIYSIGYMHNDKGFWRFFAYLNLFIFAMLNLVFADNFILMFLGWEGVGLCSYLLIGFWYDRKFENSTTADAAKKAFIVNRIGDFGFLLGLFLIYMTFGSLKFNTVFMLAEKLQLPEITLTLITLFLFIGATGKSAQIPLYVWLPDAMAGPTPVSALIHAATMVTAGVYMVSRCSILFVQAPTTLMIITIIGLMTAFFSATIGLVQNDIKKVLAYSTVSQLGFMFLAAGVGAFATSIFHLMTHAFFKALLFLGAGSVIHSLHDEQDIRKMGGLKSIMPITYKTFFIAVLAISGIPPLSGFFSKDEILWKAFSQGSTLIYFGAIATAFMTAFYTSRLLFLTFDGNKRWHSNLHPHESPKVMTIPLIILAILSAFGGFIGLPVGIFGENANLLENWLKPIFEPSLAKLPLTTEHSHLLEYILMLLSVGIALTAIFFARKIYLENTKPVDVLRKKFKSIYDVLLHKYYVDEFYELVIIKPIKFISEKIFWKIFDVKIIDGFLDGTANLTLKFSEIFRKVQNGIAQFYAVVISIGIIFLLIILFFI